MDHTVTGSNVPFEWRDGVKQAILEAFGEVGVNYDFTTFRWSADEIEVVHTADGSAAPEGVAVCVSLPAVEQTLKNWKKLLVAASQRLQGIMVTIPVQGVVQAALNGNVL